MTPYAVQQLWAYRQHGAGTRLILDFVLDLELGVKGTVERRRRDLDLIWMTPDILYDQLVAARARPGGVGGLRIARNGRWMSPHAQR
jgi:hypothetical protein